ncbi:hypothetical protein GCM10011491_45260 [Brucella endophytica]|uniref:D,D-heptose 1,7-bisphosphate phosphatase n=2 Tax=Brucella endophytica TaxID=1963359 RepID=A0A916SR21_9HYPH|nr:hypothetical protein GCM10011491_45260 [Brucella endophytica]
MSIFIVTNQAGIGRGYYTENQFHDLTQWMLGCFTAEAITIDGVYFCPFHPTHGVGRYKVESQDRKPGPGMILRASKEYNIDLSKSVLVGDRETDIAAAKRAGVGKSVLFSSNQILTLKPDFIVDSLRTVKQILSEI